jgi:hypothetical protein
LPPSPSPASIHPNSDPSFVAVAGHGWRAKRAVEIFLDEVLEREGVAAMQEAWSRIWDGFLAFDGLGHLGAEIREYFRQNPTPADRVIDMMNRKAMYGGQNHESRRLGGDTINSLFGKPDSFVQHLANSAWIVAGNPEASPLMHHLVGFDGPMFEVFDERDLQIWRDWIVSLKSFVKQTGSLDSYGAMRNTVRRMMVTAMDVPHHTSMKLWGPSPNDPTIDVEQTVASWLTAAYTNPTYVMAALKHPKNKLITCGNHEASYFVTHTLAPNNEMGTRFARYAAETDNLIDGDSHTTRLWTWYDIVCRWIDDGCPMEANGNYNLFPPPGFGPDIKAAAAHVMMEAEMMQMPERKPTKIPTREELEKGQYRRGRHYVH